MNAILPPENLIAPLLRWQAPGRVVQERGKRWYLIGGLIVLGVTVYGIVTGSWTLAVIALLCAAAEILVRGHVPPIHEIAVTAQGIFYDGEFISFADLRGFWVIRTPLANELHLARRKRGGEITILTGDVNPLLIRGTLVRSLHEESDRTERPLDIFIRLCKL